jgi:hypothetical protein
MEQGVDFVLGIPAKNPEKLKLPSITDLKILEKN